MSDSHPKWLAWINPSIHVAWQGRWRRGHVESVRYLPDHELVVFTQGHCVVEMAGQTFDCGPNTFLIVPPNLPHMTVAGAGKVHRYCVHFDWTRGPQDRLDIPWVWKSVPLPRTALRKAPRWVPPEIQHGAIEAGHEVHTLLDTLIARWTAGGQLNRAICRATFLEVLLRLLSRPVEPVRSPDRAVDLALRVKMLLDDIQDDRPDLPTLLAPLGYSYEHLSRLFRDAFGVSPLAYLNLQRLERAKVLLRDPSLSVAAVARLSGFEDPNYFSRVFRRHAGMPPRRYSHLIAKPGKMG